MTGANRLLIGIGWSMVVFIAWYRLRRRRADRARPPLGGHPLDREHAIELWYLRVATVYSLTLPLKRSITLIDAVILVVAVRRVHVARLAGAGRGTAPRRPGAAHRIAPEHDDVAPRDRAVPRVGVGDPAVRRGVREAPSRPPAAGRHLEFLLVQWLAPLASEAPELLVAGLFAWRLNTNAGLGTLVSSKVNQWTLLVGTLPIVFAISSASLHGLPIDAVQREELFLTAAQSFFAVAVLSNLWLSLREAGYLFGLFWAQFVARSGGPRVAARGRADRGGQSSTWCSA